MQTITIAPPKRSWFSLLSWAVVLAVLVVSWQGAEMAPLTLIKDGGNMATFAADFFPPDFSQWQDYLTEMAVTLQIAVWGTALAVVLSIPFGLMSAENLVPWWVYQPVRRLMDACRAINEMVFAMLFVVAVGLGPFAGVLACWRCLSTPPACSPSCFPKRWKRLSPARWQAKVILADEPIASLDPESARIVMDTLRDINQNDGITVVVTLHQVDYALRYCERIVALRQGHVFYDGSSQQFDNERFDHLYRSINRVEENAKAA